MDETEKRIFGYGLAGNIAAIMAIIGILTGLGIIPPLATAIIETLMAPNLTMIFAWIRYKFKINISDAGQPETPVGTTPPG